MKRIMCLLLIVMFPAAAPDSQPDASTVSAVSADGVAFPAAASDRKLNLTLPVIGNWLGAKPKEIGEQVYNWAKSGHLHKDKPKVEWFVSRDGSSEWAGLNLTDGRVTSAIFSFNKINKPRAEQIISEIRRTLAFVETTPDGSRYAYDDGNWRIDFIMTKGVDELVVGATVNRIDWHAHNHVMNPKHIRAMMARRVAMEMTLEQLKFMYGEPERCDVRKQRARCTWRIATDDGAVINVDALLENQVLIGYDYSIRAGKKTESINDDPDPRQLGP